MCWITLLLDQSERFIILVMYQNVPWMTEILVVKTKKKCADL